MYFSLFLFLHFFPSFLWNKYLGTVFVDVDKNQKLKLKKLELKKTRKKYVTYFKF